MSIVSTTGRRDLQLPTVVWYMVAQTKGYKLQQRDVAWLLGFVHAMAAHPEREPMRDSAEAVDIHRISKVFRLSPVVPFHDTQATDWADGCESCLTIVPV